MQPAIFLDRDDTLTIDVGYTYKVSDFVWKTGVLDGLKLFMNAKLPLFIVTNQGGIARQLFTEADMHDFHQHLQSEAAKFGVHFQDIAFCAHHPLAPDPSLPHGCNCRKPEAGMLLTLADKWQIDLSTSVMIGDRDSDLEAGQKAGCFAYYDAAPDDNRPTLKEQAAHILKTHFPDRLDGPDWLDE